MKRPKNAYHGPGERPLAPILSEKSLKLLFWGTFISSVGDWCRHVAVVGLVLSCSGAGLKIAVLLVLEVLPLLIVGPLAGVMIDRSSARIVMIACDVARAVLSLLFLWVRSGEPLWAAYVLTALISVFDSPSQAARLTLISKLASHDTLVRVQSLFSLGAGLCIVVGSGAATTIMGMCGNTALFVFDAGTFAVSCFALVLIREGEGLVQPCKAAGNVVMRYLNDLEEGIRYVRSNHEANSLLLFNVLRSVGSGAVYFLLGVFGFVAFDAGFKGVGYFHIAFGAGFFAGALFTRKLARWLGWTDYVRVMGLAAVVEGLFVVIFSQAEGLIPALAILSFAYVGRAVLVILYNSLTSRIIAEGIRGRYFALNKVLSYAAMGASMLACGWGLKAISAQWLAFFAGVFLLINGASWMIGSTTMMQALSEMEGNDRQRI